MTPTRPPAPEGEVTLSLFPRKDVAVAAAERTGSWDDFVAGLMTPAPPTTPKHDLPLYSPAQFRDGARGEANVITVSAIGFDIDEQPIPTRAELEAAFAGYDVFVHSSPSATADAPRWRGLMRPSRRLTAAEYRHVRGLIVARLPFRVGAAASDPSRAWFIPRAGEGGYYECFRTPGAPVDVDALLREPPVPGSLPQAPSGVPLAGEFLPDSEAITDASALLAAAWPEVGSRHDTRLALAGALLQDGWSVRHATDFILEVGGEEGADGTVAKLVAGTRRRIEAGQPVKGWGSLAHHLGGDPTAREVVAHVRDAMSPRRDFVEAVRGVTATTAAPPPGALIQAAVAAVVPSASTALVPPTPPSAPAGLLTAKWGGWDAPVLPPTYLVDSLIPVDTVGAFVAMGSSLKSWSAFSLALAVAQGRPWLGRYPTRQGPVVIVDYESGAYELTRRVAFLAPGEDLADVGAIVMPQIQIDGEEFWAALGVECLARGVVLVVVDSLAAGSGVEDENQKEASKPIEHAARMTETLKGAGLDCVVLFIHHSRKEGGGDERAAVRGNSSIYNALDWAFRFVPVSDEGGVRRMMLANIKPCMGPKPPPIGLELSDAGGFVAFDIDPTGAVAEGAKDEEGNVERYTAEDVRRAILLYLDQHPEGVGNGDKLSQEIGYGRGPVRIELKELVALGYVSQVNRMYVADDDVKRAARVKAAVLAGGEGVGSAAGLSRRAYVDEDFVHSLVTNRVLFYSTEGGGRRRYIWAEGK